MISSHIQKSYHVNVRDTSLNDQDAKVQDRIAKAMCNGAALGG